MRPSVYIAAPFEMQMEAVQLAARFKVHGIGCTSRWLTAIDDPCHDAAQMCLSDVASADAFVCLNPEDYRKRGTGGRHVEMGFALALRKPVFVIGERTNVFHYLDCVSMVRYENNIESMIKSVCRVGQV